MSAQHNEIMMDRYNTFICIKVDKKETLMAAVMLVDELIPAACGQGHKLRGLEKSSFSGFAEEPSWFTTLSNANTVTLFKSSNIISSERDFLCRSLILIPVKRFLLIAALLCLRV